MTRVNYPPYPSEGPRDNNANDKGPTIQDIYAARMRRAHADIGRHAQVLADAAQDAPDLDVATMTELDEKMWAEIDLLSTNQANG